MKDICKAGDQRSIKHIVTKDDLAVFITGMVHPFYGTFAIARDAEWSSRQFVLDIREEHEEGIGTYVTVNHHSPAGVGDEIEFIATLKSVEDRDVHCTFEARKGDRLIASGTTGQKILLRTKVERLWKEYS